MSGVGLVNGVKVSREYTVSVVQASALPARSFGSNEDRVTYFCSRRPRSGCHSHGTVGKDGQFGVDFVYELQSRWEW